MSTSAPELTPLEEEFVQKIDARLEELAAPKQEYDQLMQTRARVTGTSTNGRLGGATTRTRSTGPGRARQGNRQEEFVALVQARPGITIPEAAGEMNVAANYLYRVRNKAIEANQMRQEGQQLYPVEAGEPDPARVKELEAAAGKA